MQGGTPDGFAGPGREAGNGLATALPRIKPGELAKHGRFVVDNFGHVQTTTGLQADHVDATLGQGIGQHAATGTRANDDYYRLFLAE